VSNLIQSVPIAGKTNGWFVYSYVNVSKVYTEGLELSGRWQLLRNLDWQLGYQLLYARDRDIIDSIKAGTGSYGTITDPQTGIVRRATPGDYFGLVQRSRHQLNTKLYYHFPSWGLIAGARANYFGKAGFADQNGNGYIDRYDQFAPAYCLFSFSLEKSLLKERLSIQMSVENATNYTNALIAGQVGRQLFAGLRWNWDKRTINQSSIKEQ
jgi:outer membrane receptor for ferrienterochelin and colicins